MTSPFVERIRSGLTLLDGATGTELDRRGVPTPLPLWSAGALRDQPDVVRAIHKDYVDAGAEIVITNTFRTNVRTLRNAEQLDQGLDLNRIAVKLARESGARFVAGGIAPVEDCYHPERVPEKSVLLDEHGQMVEWLKAAKPDVIWIETINCIREAVAAAESAADSGLPFLVSFVPNAKGTLLSGESFEEAVAAVEPLGAAAFGVNCIPPQFMETCLENLLRATKRPVCAYAHLGEPEPKQGWSFSVDVPPDEYAEYARRWRDQGAVILGGCCGTSPAHIRALAKMV